MGNRNTRHNRADSHKETFEQLINVGAGRKFSV